ncbi:hypothetical protein GCM10008932_22250 [Alkalibacterium iburiense]|uniref:Uncharacterized protein n=1 Tax=Alkalibacterium iburiense TaxID=290589 RepID=A0ABN0XQK5_9LACT
MADKKGEYRLLAEQIIERVGGEDNISNVIHCVTRLRFYLKDESVPNDKEIETLKGVLGVAKGSGQYQVIVGQQVDDIYKEVESFLSLSEEDVHTEQRKEDESFIDKIKRAGNGLIGVITGSMMPIISILAASGIIKSILALLTTSGLVEATGTWYLIIDAMADAVFFFLPILIGYNAARRLGGNPVLTAVVGGVIIYPSILEAADSGMNILTLGSVEFPFVSYTYSIFPMILAAWLIKKLEQWLKTWVPTVIQSLFIPIVVIGLVSTITFVITGPVITWLSLGMATGLESFLGWNAAISAAIINGFYQILVIFGLHWGIIPIYVNDFATLGYSYFSAIVSMTIVGQGGAALAVAVKSRKPELKEIGYAGAISAFCGITEPAIYGINLRFRRPFICASIASAIGGFFTGLLRVNMWSIIGSIIGLPSYIDPEQGINANFWYAVMITFLTLGLAFRISKNFVYFIVYFFVYCL